MLTLSYGWTQLRKEDLLILIKCSSTKKFDFVTKKNAEVIALEIIDKINKKFKDKKSKI